MTVSRDVVLNIIADTKESQKNMREFLGFTEKQARSASLAIFKQQIKDQAKAAKEAKKEANKAADGWRQAFRHAAADVATDFARQLGGFAVDTATRIMEARTEMVRFNRESGVSLEVIGGLKVAAQNAGLGLSDVEEALQSLPERMKDAAGGTGEAAEAFGELGVDVVDAEGKLRQADEVFRDVVARLQDVESASDRAALANLAFGDAGIALSAALGDVPLETFIAQAERYGQVLDDDAIAATQRWNVALSSLAGVVDGATTRLFDLVDATQLVENFTLGIVALEARATSVAPKLQVVAASAVTLATAFARSPEEIEAASVALRDAVRSLDDVERETNDSIASFIKQREALKGVGEAAREAGGGWHEFVGPLPPTKDQLRDLEKTQKKVTETTRKTGEAAHHTAIEYDDLGRAVRRAAREAEEAARVQDRVLKQRTEVIESAREAAAEAERASAEVLESTKEQVFEATADRANELANLAGSFRDVFDAIGQFIEQRGEKTRNRIRSISDEQERIRQEAKDADSAEAKAKLRLDAQVLQAKKNTLKAQAREQKKAMRLAFDANKTAALTEIAINTAVAVTRALRDMGPLAGPIAAGAIAITGATQAALVASQKPPKLHTGGGRGAQFTDGPDEYGAILRGRERVLNERAVQRYGEENVDRMNRDEPVTSSPTIVQVMIGGERYAEVVARKAAAVNGSFDGATTALASPYRGM